MKSSLYTWKIPVLDQVNIKTNSAQVFFLEIFGKVFRTLSLKIKKFWKVFNL